MLIAGTILLDGLAVGGCAIAFVAGEVILRILLGKLHHLAIAPYFCHNAGAGNAEVLAVPSDYGGLGDGGDSAKGNGMDAIYKAVIGFDLQFGDRPFHCQQGSLENV